jgi:hypothetical protein
MSTTSLNMHFHLCLYCQRIVSYIGKPVESDSSERTPRDIEASATSGCLLCAAAISQLSADDLIRIDGDRFVTYEVSSLQWVQREHPVITIYYQCQNQSAPLVKRLRLVPEGGRRDDL